MEFLSDAISILEGIVSMPNQRLFYGYLVTSAMLALWLDWRTNRQLLNMKSLVAPSIWWSRSAQLDYKLIASNALFKVGLLGNFIYLGLFLSESVSGTLGDIFPGAFGAISLSTAVVVYTVAHTVCDDLSVYGLHRLQHKVPLLWSFHQIHHSATHLTPFTQLRIHPIELILNNLRAGLVFGLISGAMGHLGGGAVGPVTFMSVNALAFIFFAFGANLRHSHVQLKYWHFIEKVFISPLQHQIHHSVAKEHHDRNFGSKFAVWDWWFGTLVRSREVGDLEFGLKDNDLGSQSLKGALLGPFLLSDATAEPADRGT